MRNYEKDTQEIENMWRHHITVPRNIVPRSHCSQPERGRCGYHIDLRDFRETSGTQGTIYFGSSEPITERNFREFIDLPHGLRTSPAFEVRRKLYL